MGALRRPDGAFTLIELLIVVAIIAILALIAVPNFLEAQTRAKTARVKADMRSIATAVEAYLVDNSEPPVMMDSALSGNPQANRGGLPNFWILSTPVAYMTSLDIRDPFSPDKRREYTLGRDTRYITSSFLVLVNIDHYRNNEYPNRNYDGAPKVMYCLLSQGPDFVRGPRPDGSPAFHGDYANSPFIPGDTWFETFRYDPTNGTVSNGDIIRWPGGN